MDIYDNTNVLDEVESLFNKLESTSESTKQGVYSKIHEKLSLTARPKLCTASGKTLTSSREQNFSTEDKKKKEDYSCSVSKTSNKGKLSFSDSPRNRSTKRMVCNSWQDDVGIDETLETLHEMLFSDDPWNDHNYYENRSYVTNISQNEDESKWLFEGFPINSCPSNFHTYSNISHVTTTHGTLAGSKSNISKTTQNLSSQLPVDPRKKPFVCIECNRAFPDVYHLNLHKKRHKGEKDFLCDQCPYMNCNKDELKSHIQRMHLKLKTLCEYCGNLFASMVNLKEHIKRVHFEDKSFVCYQCSYTTYSHLALRKHVLHVHESQRYLHICPVCGLKTKGKQNLLNHLKNHIEHKSYSCDTCGKSFSLKKRLTAHKQTVHQARQFTCEVCNKPFQTKFHLDRHSSIHFNTKQFSCPFCMYASNTHGNLSKHVRSIHHKKDFSIKKYKRPRSVHEVSVEFLEKGKNVTEKYLNDLSIQLGEDITIKGLQEQRLLHEMAREVELLKSKKIYKNLQAVDHSYSEKIGAGTRPIEVTVSKIDFERSLQAHYQRVQEALDCNRPGAASNKSDQMLSGGDSAHHNP